MHLPQHQIMPSLCQLAVLVMGLLHQSSPVMAATITKETFIAAVYEHEVIRPTEMVKAVSRSDALELMYKNLVIYKKQAALAKQQNADILVFPEDGIYGIEFSRAAIFPYLEAIPDPDNVTWSPCTNPSRFKNSEVQQMLSCMAKDNSLYVVADMGDRVACDKESDPKCPIDGRYQFNTAVAYDPNGFLVAKYHKRNLYHEFQFDTPEALATYFDTPFGRFGMLICFDLLFKDPAVTLVASHKVPNVLFTTAWMDSLPYLSAVGFHSSFARAMGINLLGANIHLPEKRFHGSGIYTPKGVANFYYNNTLNSPGHLVVSEIDILKEPLMVKDMTHSNADLQKHLSSFTDLVINGVRPEKEFHAEISHDLFTFRLLEDRIGNITVCNNGSCCYLNYEMQEGSDVVDTFAFGAFDGWHRERYIQVCTLVRCLDRQDSSSCGARTKESSTLFRSLYMKAVLQTNFIFPQVILSRNGQLDPSTIGQWNFTSSGMTTRWIESSQGFDQPLLSATLLGRDYTRDKIQRGPKDEQDKTVTTTTSNNDSSSPIGVNTVVYVMGLCGAWFIFHYVEG